VLSVLASFGAAPRPVNGTGIAHAVLEMTSATMTETTRAGILAWSRS
jgi:hypothetical protein